MTEENKIPSSQDMDSIRFFSLVSMFASSAYHSMGKIANPATGKIERDMDSAQGFIDILIMLKKKTSGNLTENEAKIMESTISDLQINFVQEKNKPEPKKEKTGEEEERAEETKEDKEKVEEKIPRTEPEEEKTGDRRSGPIITPPPPESEEEKTE